MRVRADVKRALEMNKAVVALESNLISYGGRHFPENLQVARAMEQAVRDEGVVPATVAVLSGEPVIGLDNAQMEYLAQSKSARKCSRRDLAIVVAKGLDGATTVCGTMVLANQAGIRVFATGGIGGVHRGHPFDVSADLEELARTPMVVVCSGAKALLDLEATRERLETLGVPVLGYETEHFPAFFSRDSGLPADIRVDGPEEVVAIDRARSDSGLKAALLVVVPVPVRDELPREEAEAAIAQAIRLADERGVRGKAVTPFLLGSIAELTGGRSRQANLSLLVNNARVAARIARCFAMTEVTESRSAETLSALKQKA